MDSGSPMIEEARRTLRLEAEAIEGVAQRVDGTFQRAVELLLACKGRVVVSGMGKSGLVGKKIAATLASTGTPAFFLHPAEASHGDMGMITHQDVLMVLSNSGETEEVIALLPVIKRLGAPMIALVGRPDSTLGRESEVVLDVSVAREACPLGLAPTCSTTAALAMGDAVAVALLNERAFSPEQFAERHPGGMLGKRLLLRVADLMHDETGAFPAVGVDDSVHDALFEMTEKRFGMTTVQDADGNLAGIITDGDLRRCLERDDKLLTRRAGEIMTVDPKSIAPEALAVEAVRMMEDYKITSLIVRGEETGKVGLIHLHDLLSAGLM